MRIALLVLSLFLCINLFAQNALATDITLQTLEGEDFSSARLLRSSGPTVIAFWATWCAPCKKELDAYASHYDSWREQYGAEVYAVTIDGKRQLAAVPEMVKLKGWPFPVLSDAEQILLKSVGGQSVPQVVVIDAEGKIIYSHAGYAAGDEEQLAEVLEGKAAH